MPNTIVLGTFKFQKNVFKKKNMSKSEIAWNSIYAMPGAGTAIFLEWVKASTTDKHVGIRVHLFSNRKCSTSKCQALVQEMIENNAIRAKKQGRKSLMNVMPHDSWQSITSYFEYARQICDVYKNDHSASSDMDNAKVSLLTHKTHPLQVFSIDSKSFAIHGGQESQNNINNYKFGNAFTFPDMNRVYRMMPSDLNIDKFFRKYLPDYFFTRVKFPEAIIYDDDDNEDGFKMYVLPHLACWLHSLNHSFVLLLHTHPHYGQIIHQ